MRDWQDSLKGVLVGGLTGAAVGLGGFFMAEIPETNAMGLVMFLLVPFAAGFAITLVSRDLQTVSAAAILAAIGSLALLIAMHIETPVCALLAFPFLFVGICLGGTIGFLAARLAANSPAQRPHINFAGLAFDAALLFSPATTSNCPR